MSMQALYDYNQNTSEFALNLYDHKSQLDRFSDLRTEANYLLRKHNIYPENSKVIDPRQIRPTNVNKTDFIQSNVPDGYPDKFRELDKKQIEKVIRRELEEAKAEIGYEKTKTVLELYEEIEKLKKRNFLNENRLNLTKWAIKKDKGLQTRVLSSTEKELQTRDQKLMASLNKVDRISKLVEIPGFRLFEDMKRYNKDKKGPNERNSDPPNILTLASKMQSRPIKKALKKALTDNQELHCQMMGLDFDKKMQLKKKRKAEIQQRIQEEKERLRRLEEMEEIQVSKEEQWMWRLAEMYYLTNGTKDFKEARKGMTYREAIKLRNLDMKTLKKLRNKEKGDTPEKIEKEAEKLIFVKRDEGSSSGYAEGLSEAKSSLNLSRISAEPYRETVPKKGMLSLKDLIEASSKRQNAKPGSSGHPKLRSIPELEREKKKKVKNEPKLRKGYIRRSEPSGGKYGLQRTESRTRLYKRGERPSFEPPQHHNRQQRSPKEKKAHFLDEETMAFADLTTFRNEGRVNLNVKEPSDKTNLGSLPFPPVVSHISGSADRLTLSPNQLKYHPYTTQRGSLDSQKPKKSTNKKLSLVPKLNLPSTPGIYSRNSEHKSRANKVTGEPKTLKRSSDSQSSDSSEPEPTINEVDVFRQEPPHQHPRRLKYYTEHSVPGSSDRKSTQRFKSLKLAPSETEKSKGKSGSSKQPTLINFDLSRAQTRHRLRTEDLEYSADGSTSAMYSGLQMKTDRLRTEQDISSLSGRRLLGVKFGNLNYMDLKDLEGLKMDSDRADREASRRRRLGLDGEAGSRPGLGNPFFIGDPKAGLKTEY